MAGEPPVKNQPRLSVIPPAKKHHRLRVFIRGKATSRAPICRGMIKLKNAALRGMITRKHHGCSMHSEHLVVFTIGKNRHVVVPKLRAYEKGFNSTDNQEKECG